MNCSWECSGVKTWVVDKPLAHGGMFVGPVVVQDHVDVTALRRAAINCFEEGEKLKVPV